MENLEQREGNSKVRSRGKKAGTRTLSQVDPGPWKKGH